MLLRLCTGHRLAPSAGNKLLCVEVPLCCACVKSSSLSTLEELVHNHLHRNHAPSLGHSPLGLRSPFFSASVEKSSEEVDGVGRAGRSYTRVPDSLLLYMQRP